MANAMAAKAGPEKWWVPGDWNAFFGFGTNVLVNVLVLTRPSAASRMPDRGVGESSPPSG